MTEKSITSVIIECGIYRIGGINIHADGTKEKHPGGWTPDVNGGSVCVVAYDMEHDEQIGKADLFSRYDTEGIAKKTREILGLNVTNEPDIIEIYEKLKSRDGFGIDLCEVCGRFDICGECVVREHKDGEDEAE